MFINKPKTKSGLDNVIDSVVSELNSLDTASDDYSKTVDQLTKLYAIKDAQSPQRVSKDTLLVVAGNLLGIIVIVGHEQAHVVTSKALNFVLKSR